MAGAGVALQLYTVRADAARDFVGTLRAVARAGYPAVEFAGLHGTAPERVRELLGELGLQAAGTHTGIDELQQRFEEVVRLHHTLGCTFCTVPSLPSRYTRDEAGFRRAAADLEDVGRRLRAEGITLAYHNHAHEFVRCGERYGLDVLYESSDPQYVHAELDVYWAQRGGADPAAYVRKLGSRCSLLHLKDMAADGSFAEVGEGTMDFAPILAAGDAVGTRWLIVEQDECRRPPLEAAALSLQHLRQWGRA
jgi:sugar phosphate isomerase/epimerase